MTAINALSILLVLTGAMFIFASFTPARRTRENVPPALSKKWLVIINLMYFFFAGYIFFDIVLVANLPFPVELVTGGVFFGGAIYVYIVINLSQITIRKVREAEEALKELNESLEQRVTERTVEVKRSNERLRVERDRAQQYLDIAGVILLVIDARQNVTLINAKGCDILGYPETDIIGKNWFENFLPERMRDEVRRVFASLVKGESRPIEYFENTVMTRSGDERLIAWHNSILHNSSGQIIGTLSSGEDVTDRSRAEEALRASEEKYTKLFYHSNDGIVLHDRDGYIIDVNEKASDMLGYQKSELLSLSIADLHPPEERVLSRNAFDLILRNGFVKFEINFKKKSGELFPAEVSSSLFEIKEKPVIQGIVRDITERKRAEEQIRVLAYYDNLTGLPNRTFYKELLVRALAYAQRSKKTLAALFIDLDAFKRINDTLGHTAGDELLKAVADRLMKSVRSSDYVARSETRGIVNTVSRLGGDEFIVLLKDIAQPQDAALVARRLLNDLTIPFALKQQEVYITASIGISLYPLDGDDAESLLKNADIAMYHAKDKGKNNYQFYSHSMNAAALERLTLENELRKAMEQDELLLHYQPKLDVRSRSIVGFEALVRWQHPERGLVPPADFIPLAEETGLIVPLGEWVLKRACSQNKAWQAAGHAPVAMAVNLSNRQFIQKDLVENVMMILGETGMDPQYLELEITESAVMENPEKAIPILEGWKKKGISIAIDDFGKGYSSLAYLKKLPLDSLKIDRTFVKNLIANPEDAAITTAIIAMAHSLKLTVVAEGVETEEQLAFLQELGCDEAQGYLFSRPLPAEEVQHFISIAAS